MKYHRHKQSSKKSTHHEKKNTETFLGKDNVISYTLSTDAKGIARLEDGSIVFVEDLLPGEKALIKIHAQKSTYKRATVLNRENDSEHRATPPCPYYSKCGGCQLQHVKQEKQIDFKIQWFFETLKRVGKWDTSHISLAEKKTSFVYLKTDNYRRRIRLHFDGKNLGFHGSESNQIVPIDSCFIARKKINEKISYLKDKLISFNTSQSIPGLEFDIELTESDDEKVLFNFVNINSKEPNSTKIKQALNTHFDLQEDQLIHLKHPVLKKFKLKKESFIQPHFDAVECYYEHISNCVDSFLQACLKLKHINNHSVLHAWDLYSGCGIFSCIPYFSAKKFELIANCLAVEGVKESIDSLKLNYKNHPIEGVVEDVHAFIDKQFSLLSTNKEYHKTNIIILDPPRTGVGIPNMQKIVELAAHESCILYLACDPASFARDTQILLEGGFHLKQIFLFDSFGQTNFYEVLGFFTRGV